LLFGGPLPLFIILPNKNDTITDMEQVKKAVEAAVKLLGVSDVAIELERPDPQFGDYTTNIAMKLAKTLGKNPRDIASQIAEQLGSAKYDWLDSVAIAGPGFINIALTSDALLVDLTATTEAPKNDQIVVIETNNPNPFKAMHVGHAFNAIIADTLANLIEQTGAIVHRVSYHGDVGAHVGKSMYAILQYIDGDLSLLYAVPTDGRNAFMSKMYAQGAQAEKDNEAAKKKIEQLSAQSFLLDDPVYKEVYETCFKWSFELLAESIARLGNAPVEKRYLESVADKLGVQTVKDNVGKVFTESNGALIFDGEGRGVFTNVFVSSAGRGLYAARDLGLMQLKQADFQPNKSYIVTAEEQRDYFKGVIMAAELALPELTGVTVNISTGTVKLSTGKMSSRSGDVLDIAWLFERIIDAVKERGGEPTNETIVGAIRYQFLRVRIGGDVVFDINEAVSLHGNSGPYLQYAHARACSILQKAGADPGNLTEIIDSERPLVSKLTQYPEVLKRASNELLPHLLCNYLYELAQEFNRFYESNKVIGDTRQPQRLALVNHYAKTLKHGLGVLSIPAPEHM
jgi:arginyl-tRNA synthetase